MNKTADSSGTVTDPVCKMVVSPETAAASYEYKGETYYFCTPCKERFAADPEKYLEKKEKGGSFGTPATTHAHSTVQHGEMTATPQGDFRRSCLQHESITRNFRRRI